MSQKILLLLLPFWDPQIPPLGAACLKSRLQENGFPVKTLDANLEPQFRELHDDYFQTLAAAVPKNKQANLFNTGNQVIRNHLMAHLNFHHNNSNHNNGNHSADKTGGHTGTHTSEERYWELVRILVEETFFTTPTDHHLQALDNILADFYTRLKEYILDLLEKESPSVLGISVYGDTFAPSLAAFRWAKQKDPAIRTVMGGGIFADQMAPGSPALEHFETYSRDFIDTIIIGEGEELFLACLRGELDPSRRVFGITDIGGKVMELGPATIPDFSDFDLQYYPHLAHYGARSCPYQCKFCSETINWGKYRKKKVAQTVNEFIELHRRHSYQLFLMTDSTLNPTITDLAEEFINSGVSIYWDGFLRADRHVCDTANTLLWRRGGFYRAKLGLESGSQRVLDLMDKRITVQQGKDALAALAYAGIKTTTFWLFGFPGETEEDFQQTLDFLEECKGNIYEADCNAFNYYLTGQANSDEWRRNNKGVKLYPDWAGELLVTDTWILEGEPTRQQAYDRLNRFVEHCARLGIPNPYSLKDVYKADERWKKLHKNAVPSIVELKNKDAYIDESRSVKELSFAGNTLQDDDEDWF